MKTLTLTLRSTVLKINIPVKPNDFNIDVTDRAVMIGTGDYTMKLDMESGVITELTPNDPEGSYAILKNANVHKLVNLWNSIGYKVYD